MGAQNKEERTVLWRTMAYRYHLLRHGLRRQRIHRWNVTSLFGDWSDDMHASVVLSLSTPCQQQLGTLKQVTERARW